MGREQKPDNVIKIIVESRTARIFVVAVSAFLCIFTLFEFIALRMEWEVPVLEVMSRENGFWSEEYQREELAFDDSTENELFSDDVKENVQEPDDASRQGSAGQTNVSGDTGILADEGTNAVEEQNTEAANALSTGETDEEEIAAEPELPYYIRINRKQNCITIYTMDEAGEYTVPYKAMICSTGLYNATPRGTYQISTKYLWRELYGGVYGQYATRIHGGVLFHSVPYYSKSKSSLCTDKYNKLGQQASMGCVRLTVEDAKWIAENCPVGTTVEIYDDDDPGPLGKPEAIKIDTDSPNKGWDPTDPDEDNPWHELSEDE